MKNKKNIIKIGAFLSILIFILIPLLSSPVAAAFSVTANANTNNTLGGPTASVNIPSGPYPIIFPDNPPPNADFNCGYNFIDSNTGGTGSWHRATMAVTRNPGPNPGTVSTGWVKLNAGGSTSGNLNIRDTYTGGVRYVWTVTVTAQCWDLNTSVWSPLASGTYSVRVN